MSKKIELNNILSGGMILGFLGTIIYAVSVTNKLNYISNKLNRRIDELVADDVMIDIPRDLVKSSVEKAARMEAKYQVERAMSDATKSIVKGYTSAIENVVEDEFKLQKSDVAKTLKRKIDDIDIQAIKREVKIEAKDACIAKLQNDLDDLSDKYTEQISAMTNIYETVASKIESIGD